MAVVADIRRIALSLPETTEGVTHRNLAWRVRKNLFVWERPLHRGDIEALGELDRITVEDLAELITDAWLTQAPKRLAEAFLQQ